MSFMEMFIIAVGVSMDAFAVALCIGLCMRSVTLEKSLTVGGYFGVFQGVMPLIGYALVTQFASKIEAIDHWVAFLLLGVIGGKMFLDSFKKEGCEDRQCPVGVCTDRQCPNGVKPNSEDVKLTPNKMIPLSVATSIDALAVGISLAFLKVDIIPAVTFIGLTTFLFSGFGVRIGNVFGEKYKSKAELAGGLILMFMGAKILLEHTIFLA